MLEKAEHFEFPENALGWDQRLENIWQLFECNPSPIPGICDSPVTKREKKALGIETIIDKLSRLTLRNESLNFFTLI